MIRRLVIAAVAGFATCIVCFAGAAMTGGRQFMEGDVGWAQRMSFTVDSEPNR
jgi:hypothetical protein